MGQTTTTHGHILMDLVPLDKEQTPTETPMGTDSYSTYSHTVMQGPTPVKLYWLQQVNCWEWISLPSEWKVTLHVCIETFNTTMSCCSVVHCGRLLFKKIQKYIHIT